MPNLAAFHPQIVHFVVAMCFAGVVLRIASLAFGRRWTFLDATAALALIAGALASAAAVHSGLDAHGPVERIPGTRALVEEHEEGGETTRDIFLGVAAIEILAIVFSREANLVRYVRYAHYASAALGIWGAASLYETAEHGGELVYSYGGGPGLRTGDTADVGRVLVAALYNESQIARHAGRSAEAASLVDQIAQRKPGDRDAQFLRAESQVLDTKDYTGALGTLNGITVPADDWRSNSRLASLKADAYLGLGKPDSAKAVLREQIRKFPPNTRLKAKLDSIR